VLKTANDQTFRTADQLKFTSNFFDFTDSVRAAMWFNVDDPTVHGTVNFEDLSSIASQLGGLTHTFWDHERPADLGEAGTMLPRVNEPDGPSLVVTVSTIHVT
jgi:hypothetical protein